LTTLPLLSRIFYLSRTRVAENQNVLVNQYLLLLVIITIASLLRFYKLGEWSFWGDEYITVHRAHTWFDDGFSIKSISIMATYLSIKLWGPNEWVARLPAAIIGILTIPIFYFLVRRMFGLPVALLASSLLAISPWHVYWSQNARFYTSLLLFYTLSLLLFFIGFEKDRPLYLSFSLGFLFFAMQERMVAAFLVPTMIAYILILHLFPKIKPIGFRPRNLAIFWGFSLLGGAYILVENPTILNPTLFFENFTFINNNPFWIISGMIFYIGIPVICVAAVGGINLLIRKRREGILLVLAATIPPSAIALISLFQYTANRYIFVSLTSIIILAAVAIKELLRISQTEIRLISFGFVLILFLAPLADNFLYYRYQNGNRDNWKDAFALISSLKRDDDSIVTTHRDLADHYLHERTTSMLEISIEEYIKDRDRVWFVVDLTASDKALDVYQWILANAQLIANFDVNVSARIFPMRVYLYDPVHPSVLTKKDQ
jgi:mannosyltransferase